MADSKRQQIVTALDTRLKTILVTGGYLTDLGANVQWWRQEPFADTESGISCEDSESPPTWLGAQCQLHRLVVEIKAVMPATTAAPEIRQAAADVVTTLATDLTFGGLVEDCAIDEMPMAVAQAGTTHGGTIVKLSMEYTTAPWSAYA
jgi:hypothetical protein